MSDVYFSGTHLRWRTERRHVPAKICSEKRSAMQTSTLRLCSVAWGHRVMGATIALGLLLVFGFAQTAVAQSSAAASSTPLTFGNNFFVTADYVVAGARGMNTNMSNGSATGTINVPDANPGIQPGVTNTCVINGVKKVNCVPAGAQIVAALLYWQTVEKVGVMPGDPGSGQNGFFGPVLNNVPQFYSISCMDVTNNQTVSFSPGVVSATS